MNTLLAIDTYAGISDFLNEMWPHYEKACLAIVGIERTNSPTTWPKQIPTIACGEDVFTSWANHRSATLLPIRVLSTIQLVCEDERFKAFDSFIFAEWDTVFLKPVCFPEGTDLYLRKTGKTHIGFRAKYFFHQPWGIARRIVLPCIYEGRKMLAEGDTEHGSTDFFFGRLIERLGLSWVEIPGFSCNKLDSQYAINLARKSIETGGSFVHGVQTSEQLKQLFA